MEKESGLRPLMKCKLYIISLGNNLWVKNLFFRFALENYETVYQKQNHRKMKILPHKHFPLYWLLLIVNYCRDYSHEVYSQENNSARR